MELSGPGVMSPGNVPASPPAGADADDVSRAVAGDHRAFERLYRRHVGRVFGLATRLMSRDEAAEITQDVFVRAWSKLATFRGEAAFSTWLHRLAVNLILSRRAWLGVRRGRFIDDAAAIETAPARPGQSDLGMDFERAIGKLPEGARAVFVLHDVEGYKHEEIASFMKVTTGTTKAQLHRARMMLRGHLGARQE
jgi:RNA polymerase sigma-70 factor (ECF subfamily)